MPSFRLENGKVVEVKPGEETPAIAFNVPIEKGRQKAEESVSVVLATDEKLFESPISVQTDALKYTADGLTEVVGIDTVTPANNNPLPTNLYNTNGERGTLLNPIENNVRFSNQEITKMPSGALMTANPSIIFDGKILNADDTTLLWENVGTGTFTFTGNKVNMVVTAGQYCIRQSRRRMPYFSGYPQIIEQAFDNFNIEANVVKRIGYFSSNEVAPFQTSRDGFWLEMDGITYRLKAERSGTPSVNVPFADWDNYSLLSAYDFNNFSAIYFDFLWLGGAALRIWVCTADKGWVLGHSVSYIGNNQDTICTSPNQPLRYEIVSSTGTGDMRYICSQVSVGGNVDKLGFATPYINTAAIACNTIGTIYVLQGFKKNATYRDIAIKLISIGCINAATTDTGMLLFLRNPTLSAPLVYVATGKIDRAIATTQTVTAVNEIIAVIPNNVGAQNNADDNYKLWFTQLIANTFDEYVLAYLSTSSNQDIRGIVTLKEF